MKISIMMRKSRTPSTLVISRPVHDACWRMAEAVEATKTAAPNRQQAERHDVEKNVFQFDEQSNNGIELVGRPGIGVSAR
jgi:hypothetical protein